MFEHRTITQLAPRTLSFPFSNQLSCHLSIVCLDLGSCGLDRTCLIFLRIVCVACLGGANILASRCPPRPPDDAFGVYTRYISISFNANHASIALLSPLFFRFMTGALD